jgi:putative membrane protein
MLQATGTRRTLAIVSAMLVVAACDSGDRAEVDTALASAVEAIGEATDSAAGRLAGREYTNAEFAAFLTTYSDAEIETGQMAQSKATDAEVRAFARELVTSHRAMKTEVANTAKQNNVTPSIAADDEALTEEHQEGMKDLNGRARGAEFDEAYLEHEISMHRRVLDVIEDALDDNRNAEIQPLLVKARDGIRAHLTKAEELEKKFGT